VLKAAIELVEVNGVRQRAHRVDLRQISDSVITEILDGIRRCRVFLADISTIGHLEGRPVRNANVLYEVGLAQAVRLPEEVLLFRSDRDELLFDVTNIRVNKYHPDEDPSAARNTVTETILASLRELDLRKHLAVHAAAHSLGFAAWQILVEAQTAAGVRHPPRRTFREAIGGANREAAIVRLLDLRAIRMEFVQVTTDMLGVHAPREDLVRYRTTPFGAAIFRFGADRLGLLDPRQSALLRQSLHDESSSAETG
jgi:hypothetical protein